MADGALVTVDIIAGYQCVWQGRHQEAVSANRSLFWGKLSALMQTLPTRNLVVVAMDANTHLQPLPGLVGRGFFGQHNIGSWSLRRCFRRRI